MSARLMELAWNADTPEDLPRQSCRWLLTHIASLAGEDGRALVDGDEAAKRTGLGPMQVEAALFRLKQNGLISYNWLDGARLSIELHLEPAA